MENPTLGCRPLTVGKADICRLCMKTHEYYLNIFVKNEGFKMSIGKAIEDLLVLEVAKDDNLPEMVCCPCVTKLMEFREFKEMCMNSAREFGRHAPVEPITCPVKDEFLPVQLLGEATSGTWSNCVGGESRVSLVPDDLSLDPFALENQTDTKEVCPRDPLGESDDCGEEDFAETKCNEDAAVSSESKQLLVGDQGEVKKELESTELLAKGASHSSEIIDEGDSSHTGGPILLSDILAVMGMVDRCNNIGGVTEKPEKECDKFGADRQGSSQNKVVNNPSCDPVREENLQVEYSMANSFVVDCFPERRVKKQKKNVKDCASSKTFSQINDREKPVGNHEGERLCHQAESTSYPTEYVRNYCSTRYSEKNPLALHIKGHVDGKRSARVLPEKDFPPRFSQNLLVRDPGNVEPVILETSHISFTQNNSRRKNEKPTVEESSEGENSGREPHHSRTLLFHSIKPREEAAFVCDICGISFLEKNDLLKHVNVHTGLSPFHCRFCGEILISQGMLNGHQAMHTGVEWPQCNQYGKECRAYRYQRESVVTHTNFKSWKCDLCGKNFKNADTLRIHSATHTGVKPFKCNECGKMFTRNGDLIRHSVVHTGVKRFKCNQCGQMFSASSDLMRHSVVHTGVKRFKCNQCGQMFTQSGSLRRHLRATCGVNQF